MSDTSTELATTHRFRADPLRLARLTRGWTLQRLANVTGLSIATVSRILAGKTAGVASVKEVANALGVDVAECYTASSPGAPEQRPEGESQ